MHARFSTFISSIYIMNIEQPIFLVSFFFFLPVVAFRLPHNYIYSRISSIQAS